MASSTDWTVTTGRIGPKISSCDVRCAVFEEMNDVAASLFAGFGYVWCVAKGSNEMQRLGDLFG